MAPLGQSWVSHGDSQDHERWRRSQAQGETDFSLSLPSFPRVLNMYSASPPSLNACCMWHVGC